MQALSESIEAQSIACGPDIRLPAAATMQPRPPNAAFHREARSPRASAPFARGVVLSRDAEDIGNNPPPSYDENLERPERVRGGRTHSKKITSALPLEAD